MIDGHEVISSVVSSLVTGYKELSGVASASLGRNRQEAPFIIEVLK